jgi:hypothetical protein
MGIRIYQRLSDAKQQLKQAIDALVSTNYVESPQWAEEGKITFTPGVRYSFGEVIPHKDRKTAAQTKKNRRITSQPPIHLSSNKEPIDALLPICSLYAQTGWPAAELHAKRKGLSEAELRRETQNRGLIPLD